jgi:hypothetical protein
MTPPRHPSDRPASWPAPGPSPPPRRAPPPTPAGSTTTTPPTSPTSRRRPAAAPTRQRQPLGARRLARHPGGPRPWAAPPRLPGESRRNQRPGTATKASAAGEGPLARLLVQAIARRLPPDPASGALVVAGPAAGPACPLPAGGSCLVMALAAPPSTQPTAPRRPCPLQFRGPRELRPQRCDVAGGGRHPGPGARCAHWAPASPPRGTRGRQPHRRPRPAHHPQDGHPLGHRGRGWQVAGKRPPEPREKMGCAWSS